MTLRARLRGLTGGGMFRDVLRLVSGTLGGRLIALAAMPVVTRLYSPDDFALLAVYLGAVGMGGAIACLRLDFAIPVADDDKDAAHLLALALLIALGLATTLMIAALFVPQRMASLLGQPRLEPWVWMIPLGILMAGNYSALQFWATRMRRFGSIAITRLTQAAIGVATMLGLGWAAVAPFGLLFGSMLSASAGSVRLGRDALRAEDGLLRLVTWRGLTTAFRDYRRFPIYSTPEALANIAGTQVPIMIVAAHAGAEAGYLLLAQQVMAAPMALLGSSIAQVYVSRAPAEMREGRLADFTLGILRRLVQTGIGPLILGALIAPLVFPFLFGPRWVRAGEIMVLMLPWMALQFLASPVSMVLHVTMQQKIASILQIFGMALRISVVYFSPYILDGNYVLLFLIVSALFYAIYLIVIMHISGISKSRSRIMGFLKSFIYIIPWAVLGIFLMLCHKIIS